MSDAHDHLPVEAFALALAGLPGATPRRLGLLLGSRGAQAAWEGLAGHPPQAPRVLVEALGEQATDTLGAWQRHVQRTSAADGWERHLRSGVGVVVRGSPAYPDDAFVGEPWPPEVLLHLGDPDRLAGARVAVVGTRACTQVGRAVATRLGAELAEAGVAVVSGLALGIDTAAHAGALGAAGSPAIGVVGSGLDVVYPSRNRALWHHVATEGLLFSEHPLGTAPVARHFPARNRILAALADVVVVVESHRRGGALGTAAAARRLGRTVLAVPGPVVAEASGGTNDLLADGAGVCRGADDVLLALGMTPGARRRAGEDRPSPTGEARTVLTALGWTPATASALIERTGLALGAVSVALAELAEARWITERAGWYERLPRAAGPAGAGGGPATATPTFRDQGFR